MNEKELMLKAIAEMSVKYGKKEIEVVEAVVEMVSQILDTQPIGHRKMLSIYLYAFGCLEIYRTVALNGGIIASSLSGVDRIYSPSSITRVIFTEAYSAIFISHIHDKKEFEWDTNMMCTALFKNALSHYLSNHNTEYLFKNLRLQNLISIEEAEKLESYMYLLNELMPYS